MAGLTDEGLFERPSLTDIISEVEVSLREAFQIPEFTVEDNENIGQLVKVEADRENKVWQALEQIYRIWTLDGAEGSFLDETYALNGIFREGATAGSGDAVVETDSSAIDSTLIVTGTLFSGTNGLQYASLVDNIVSSRVTAYNVDATSIPLDTYNFTITNRVTDEVFAQSVTLAAGDTASREAFLTTIQAFLQSVNPSETNIHLDTPNLTLYWGFNAAFDLVGLEETTDFAVTPSVGNRFTLVECVATTTGFNPLGPRSITAMSVLPTGYVSVTNINQFSSGTDIETDAAFVERARQTSDSPRSATRTAIISGLLNNVEGVQSVSVDKRVVGGTVEVEPIVIGGEIVDIATELYNRQGINNIFSGTISYDVPTLDGKVETIRFTRGITQQLNVRIKYKTATNTALSETEQSAVIQNLLDLSETWRLGYLIFNFSLLSAVSSAVEINRFTSLVVETKELEEPDTSYTTSDYQADPDILPDLLSPNILFVQEIV